MSYQVTLESNAEGMAPLRGFAYAMSLSCPVAGGKTDFSTLNVLVNAATQSPTDVTLCLKVVKDAKTGGTSGLLTGFRLLPQGKRLLSLAEEHVDSCQESIKAVTAVDDVKSKASTFPSAVKSMKMNDLVNQTLELLSTLRSLQQLKCIKDHEGGQAALEGAETEVAALCNDLCDHHVLSEAVPWIESQTETLKTSQIMCKPPGWEVMKLAAEFKAVFRTELQTLLDLSRFYTCAGELAAHVEASLKLPPGDSSACREHVLKLCQASHDFGGSKAAVFMTCPGLYISCTALTAELEGVVSSQCVRAWQESLAGPRALVAGFISQDWKNDTFKDKHGELEKVTGNITDARLLATGFGQETQQSVMMATRFVDAALKFAKAQSSPDSREGLKLLCLHEVFVAVELAEKGSL